MNANSTPRDEFNSAIGIRCVSGFHHVEGYPKPIYSSSPPHAFDNELELGVWGSSPVGYAWEYMKGNITWEEFSETWDRNLMLAADRKLEAMKGEWDTSRW
jgi:hypothetical protein